MLSPGKLAAHRDLIADVEKLKRLYELCSDQVLRQSLLIDALTERTLKLEEKRGPGRPKNERIAPSSN